MTAETLTHELVTPTAFLVYSGEPHTPEWFATRRAGITATDLPKITGDAYEGNATDVWAKKLGLIPEEDITSEEAEMGTLLEPFIADLWSRRNGGVPLLEIGVLANVERPWLLASLDRRVMRCPDNLAEQCACEIKTRSEFVIGKWHQEIPDDVYVQVMTQMVVTGYRHIHVAALFGRKLRSFRVDWDDDDAAFILAEADRIWEAIQTQTRPTDIPNGRLLTSLDRLYPNREGFKVAPASTLDALIADWDQAREDLSNAEKVVKAADLRRKEAIARLVDLMGDAEGASSADVDENGDVLPETAVPRVAYPLIERAGYTVKPTSYQQLKTIKTTSTKGART